MSDRGLRPIGGVGVSDKNGDAGAASLVVSRVGGDGGDLSGACGAGPG